MSKELADALDAAAAAAALAAPVLPGPGGIIAQIVAIATKTAASFAREGKDPVREIERIHSAEAGVASVNANFNQRIAERFPRKPVDHAAETVPSPPPSDPYEESKP